MLHVTESQHPESQQVREEHIMAPSLKVLGGCLRQLPRGERLGDLLSNCTLLLVADDTGLHPSLALLHDAPACCTRTAAQDCIRSPWTSGRKVTCRLVAKPFAGTIG